MEDQQSTFFIELCQRKPLSRKEGSKRLCLIGMSSDLFGSLYETT